MWGRSSVCVRWLPLGARAHRTRGKPPHLATTIRQRLEQLNYRDPLLAKQIDIGLPVHRASTARENLKRVTHRQKIKSDPEMERLARNNEFVVDMADVEDEWLQTNGPREICAVAEYYDVYKHLYGEGYFVPRVNLSVSYDLGDELCPVYHGNVVKPTEAKREPVVEYEAEEGSLWTLILTNLDGHLTETEKEYVHWCVANIPENDIQKGDTIVEYMQPIPVKGTGFHRYVFVLYKQNGKVDYDIQRVSKDCLEERTFVTRDWYAKYQDIVTPGGLAFFQSNWDSNLTQFFHENLNMSEPVYEYEFPKPYVIPQEWFPLRKAFNTYLDRYRNPKDVAKDYFLRKLKTEHPFKRPDPPLKFPNAQAFPKDMPSWQKVHERKIRLKWGRVNDY